MGIVHSSGFLDSDDYREFKNWQKNWISRLKIPHQASGRTDDSTALMDEQDSNQTPMDDLVEYLNTNLNNLVERWGVQVIQIIIHFIVESLIIEKIASEIDLKFVTNILKSVLMDLRSQFTERYSPLNINSVYLPETYELVSESVIQENLDVSSIDLEYWKNYYSNMGIEETLEKFALKSMLMVVQMMDNKRKRLKKMKS